MSLKHCACHEKLMPGYTKCRACRAKSSSQNWRSDAPKFTSLRISAPWPNISDVSCTAPATENASFADPLQMSHACHRFWICDKTLTFCSLLTRCTIPCAGRAKRHLNVQTWSVPVSFLHFWLGNSVPRATTACTCSTSQNPKVGVFFHFDLEMCFAPQRRAMMSSLIWPHGSAPATLASLLFDPPVLQIIRKTKCFATFLYLLAHLQLLSSDSFSFLTFSSLLFSSLLFSSLLFSSLLFSSLLFSSLLFSSLLFSSLLFSSLTLLWLFSPLLFGLCILSEVWLLNFLRLKN